MISLCAAFASSTFDIGASLGINPHSHDDDGGQCSVQAAVTAAIEPVAHRLPDEAGPGRVPASEANAASETYPTCM